MSDLPDWRLPAVWNAKPLEQLVAPGSRISYGIIQPGSQAGYGVPLIRGGDIFDGKIQVAQLRSVAPDIAMANPHTVLQGGELLMSLVGYPGEVALAPAELNGANIARQVACIRLGRQVDSRYVMYYLQSDLGRHDLFQKLSGSAQQVLNLVDLKKLLIVTPPLTEQIKIADILADAAELTDMTRKKIKKLIAVKTGMMQELLSNGINHTQYKDSAAGRIPDSWGSSTLATVARSLQTGPFGSLLHAHEYVASGIPLVMPKDLKDQTIQSATVAHISQDKAGSLQRYRLQRGDILFSRRGDIGRCALVREENEGWICGTGCLKVTLGAALLPEFFISYLTLPGIVEWLNNHAVGQTMLNLNVTILSGLPVVIPPLEEQQTIAAAMQSLSALIRTEEKKLQQLVSTQKALRQDLMTGRLRT